MKKFFALALTLAMSLSLAACGAKEEAPSAGSAGAAEANKVVKIGVFEPQTGDNGAGGKQEILGMQYANYVQPTVEIGGETYDVQLEIVDNRTTAENGPSAASELINRDVSVVLGSYGSGVSMAGGAVFAEAGVPAIGVTCTNPQVTADCDVYFRICFLDPFQGTVLANYAYNELGVDTAYTLAMLGSDYDQGLVYYFTEAFKALGGTVINEDFPEGSANFVSYINNAKSAGAGAIFAPVSTNYAQLSLRLPVLRASTALCWAPIPGTTTWSWSPLRARMSRSTSPLSIRRAALTSIPASRSGSTPTRMPRPTTAATTWSPLSPPWAMTPTSPLWKPSRLPVPLSPPTFWLLCPASPTRACAA